MQMRRYIASISFDFFLQRLAFGNYCYKILKNADEFNSKTRKVTGFRSVRHNFGEITQTMHLLKLISAAGWL